MPDHIHVIVAPTQDRDAKLGNCVAALKRWMRQELNASWKWQPGSFDRLLRSDESLGDKWLYLEENPVGAGLVQRYAIVKQPHRLRGLGSAGGAPALQFSYILKRSPK
jgi:hypothetical protein